MFLLLTKITTLFALTLSLSFAQIPKLTGPVVDAGKFLNSEEVAKLTALIQEIHKKNGPQIQILTIETLKDETIEGFSIKVAEKWKIGNKECSNGILLTLSKVERAVRIEVGGGIEDKITDLESSQIINQLLIPSFKEGRFASGIELFIFFIAQKFEVSLAQTNNSAPIALKRRHQSSQLENGFAAWFLILFFIFPMFSRLFKNATIFRVIFSTLLTAGSSWFIFQSLTYLLGAIIIGIILGLIPPSAFLAAHGRHYPRSRGGFGGGGSFGGGWGGGGGGFSGGGASGRW